MDPRLSYLKYWTGILPLTDHVGGADILPSRDILLLLLSSHRLRCSCQEIVECGSLLAMLTASFRKGDPMLGHGTKCHQNIGKWTIFLRRRSINT